MAWLDTLKERNEIVHIAATGAGSCLLQDIWTTPGASQYFSGFSMPYSREETIEFIGYEPEKFCSRDTALEMAMVAYMKAYKFGSKKKPVGIGLSASVSTDRTKRSPNKVFVSVVRDDVISCEEYDLGSCSRILQDSDCSGFAQLEYNNGKNDSYQDALNLIIKRPAFINRKRYTGIEQAVLEDRYAIYPGAFNPVHEGHFKVARDVELKGRRVIFKIELDAPNKPSLTVQDCLKRASLLKDEMLLFTKGIPLFIDKARTFEEVPFVIGSDSLQRMLDPSWGPEVIPMLHEFSRLDTIFYVSPRMQDGNVLYLDEVIKDIPPELSYMFHELPEGIEMSSTAIRQASVV